MDLNELSKRPKQFDEHENNLKGIKQFFGDKEAAFFSSVGREITEGILLESFLLYRIDLKKTQVHALYGEAIQKRWLPEIEIFGRINVEVEDPSYHVKGGVQKKGFGKIAAHVYIEQLDELGLVTRQSDNTIIFGYKMGDFMGFKGQYYKIVDDGYSQINNKSSWAGDRRFYVSIKGVEVDEDVFRAR